MLWCALFKHVRHVLVESQNTSYSIEMILTDTGNQFRFHFTQIRMPQMTLKKYILLDLTVMDIFDKDIFDQVVT